MLTAFIENMETLDEMASTFSDLPAYQSPVSAKELISKILNSLPMKIIQNF